jgi:serine-type D-Ala-D-Ala carboxypeptidase
VFPAATLEIGSSAGPIWSEAFETSLDTPFDLASLTKVVATTTVVMELVRTGALRIDDRVSEFFPEWRGADRETVTVCDLLEHAAGLSARLVDAPPGGRREFEHDICTMPLEYAPRTGSIYSDLGFLLLGFLVVDRGGSSLAEQFTRLMIWLEPDLLTFDLPMDRRRRAAPTRPMDDDRRRGRLLVGEVHDEYAAALGGVAGHAGLFGTASAVGAFARAFLRSARGSERGLPHPLSPSLVREFITKTAVAGSSRALGWDTMLPTSSCGTRMSPEAFGHVGYTGTSLWIDPTRDRYFVLLTNRVFSGGTLDQMRTVRRAFHDALGDV